MGTSANRKKKLIDLVQSTTELITKYDNPKIVQLLIKDGKLDPKILRIINEISVAESMSMTLEQVRDMDPIDFDLICAFFSGRDKGIKQSMKKT